MDSRKLHRLEKIFGIMNRNADEAMRYAHKVHEMDADSGCARLFRSMANGHLGFNTEAESVAKHLMEEIKEAESGDMRDILIEMFDARLAHLKERTAEIKSMLEMK